METCALPTSATSRKRLRPSESAEHKRFEHLRAARLDLSESYGAIRLTDDAGGSEGEESLRSYCEVFDDQRQTFVMNVNDFLHEAKPIHHKFPHLLRYAQKAKAMDYDIVVVHY